MIETIKNKLIAKLQAITTISSVYGYPISKVDSYPYVVITRASSSVEPADYSAVSKRLKRTYFFNIDLYVEMNEANFGTERSETISTEIIDSILDAFDLDVTLTGSLYYSSLTLEEAPRFQANGNIENVASFTFEGYTLVNSL